MEITGRITKDAVVNKLKDGRQVTSFTVAINDYYKPKNSTEGRKITTYVNCSYWISSNTAGRLTKGTLAELAGRIGVNAYNNLQGEAKASLTFHVNSIKLHSNSKSDSISDFNSKSKTADEITEPSEDLPF